MKLNSLTSLLVYKPQNTSNHTSLKILKRNYSPEEEDDCEFIINMDNMIESAQTILKSRIHANSNTELLQT